MCECVRRFPVVLFDYKPTASLRERVKRRSSLLERCYLVRGERNCSCIVLRFPHCMETTCFVRVYVCLCVSMVATGASGLRQAQKPPWYRNCAMYRYSDSSCDFTSEAFRFDFFLMLHYTKYDTNIVVVEYCWILITSFSFDFIILCRLQLLTNL